MRAARRTVGVDVGAGCNGASRRCHMTRPPRPASTAADQAIVRCVDRGRPPPPNSISSTRSSLRRCWQKSYGSPAPDDVDCTSVTSLPDERSGGCRLATLQPSPIAVIDLIPPQLGRAERLAFGHSAASPSGGMGRRSNVTPAVPLRPAPPQCTRRTNRAGSRRPRRCAFRVPHAQPPRAASRSPERRRLGADPAWQPCGDLLQDPAVAPLDREAKHRLAVIAM